MRQRWLKIGRNCMKYSVQANQVGLLFKKQQFKKMLKPGEYFIFSRSSRIAVIDKRHAMEEYGIELRSLQNKANILDYVVTKTIKEHELLFHFVDGVLYSIHMNGSYTFFHDAYEHTFIVVDGREINIPAEINPCLFETTRFKNINLSVKAITNYVVEEGFIGILKVNGKIEKTLLPGKHYFITSHNHVEVKMIDLRKRLLQISGQELLSKDKITMRMNFALSYQIIDAYKIITDFDNHEEQLYLLMQLALREYVSTKTLDELLAEKHDIGKIILDSIKEKQQEFSVKFIEAGLKDIILPGEIREILNTILIAEKKALANVITRREETASTRSLLNTAKLMEENTTLYKLKELEYLEKICDKVGSISLSSSGGIIEQLNEIMKTKK